MLSNHSSLTRLGVTISTTTYVVTVANSNDFYTVFNLTDRSITSLVNTGCFINSYNGNPDYSSKAINALHQVYVIFGLVTMRTLCSIFSDHPYFEADSDRQVRFHQDPIQHEQPQI